MAPLTVLMEEPARSDIERVAVRLIWPLPLVSRSLVPLGREMMPVLTLVAVHTLGIPVDLPTAVLLSVVAAVCACGASGVAGGSLLLIPLACSLFGIPSEIAMQVVAVGFIIGVLQDSAETALNSSTDVLFTAAACQAEERRNA